MDNLDLDALRALRTKALNGCAVSRGRMVGMWPRLLALVEAADELEGAGLRYRRAHDQYGDGHIKAGRAWDLWRRAQEKYAALRSGAPK